MNDKRDDELPKVPSGAHTPGYRRYSTSEASPSEERQLKFIEELNRSVTQMKPTRVHHLPKGPPKGLLFGYCRSATRDPESLARQQAVIEKACEQQFGVKPVIVIEDVVVKPGELGNPKLLQLCRDYPGATIVTEDDTRMGRRCQDIFALSPLAHSNRIDLVSVI